ncbi:hypothetical protein D3C86_1175650 [compost metagenome]
MSKDSAEIGVPKTVGKAAERLSDAAIDSKRSAPATTESVRGAPAEGLPDVLSDVEVEVGRGVVPAVRVILGKLIALVELMIATPVSLDFSLNLSKRQLIKG